MAAIWHHDGSAWRLLSPSGFPDEATLHTLVEQSPQLLPLAGDPALVIVGREVTLGNGSADLIALEPIGRLVILEIKLAKNAEARRAVVAQVLTYAAYLKGLDLTTLEGHILARHLQQRGYADLVQAMRSHDQIGELDAEVFSQGLSDSLAQGRFRLVLVLDQAPAELVQLVAYLESVTDGILIDLITISSYHVNGSQVLVPQRIEGEAKGIDHSPLPPSSPKGQEFAGADAFAESIGGAPQADQPTLHRLCAWARELENSGLVRLVSFRGVSGRWTLLPRLVQDNAGLVTIWNDHGAFVSFWRSVFERCAPKSLAHVEHVAQLHVGAGNVTRHITEELLQALTAAYREAVGQ